MVSLNGATLNKESINNNNNNNNARSEENMHFGGYFQEHNFHLNL